VSVLLALGLQTLAAVTAEKPQCESTRPQYGDTMQVQCSLRPSDVPRKFKFQVRFLGGHDDTIASLSATLNGKPLLCDEGSKPELMGEFGEVSIDCQFSSQDARELKVAVQWHHAQYSDFLLDVL
jgi:hypothetical protein